MQKTNGANVVEELTDPLCDGSKPPSDFKDMEAVFKRIGGIGRYNLLVLAVMFFSDVFPGMITLSANFTAADMTFNCSEYEYNNDTLSGCERLSEKDSRCHISYNCTNAASNLNQRLGSDQTINVGCRRAEFSDGIFQETSVSRFGLICNRAWMSNLATTFYFVGFLFGCSLYGALADRFGRLKMIIVSLLHISLCTIGVSQAPNLWLYWILQLITGIGIGGYMSVTYSYALENTDSHHRIIWGFNLHNGWTVGIFLGTLIAYFERNYQRLLLYYGLSAISVLPALLFLSESPRWLLSVKRYNQADSVLKRIAQLNGRPLGQDFSSELVASIEREAVDNDEDSGGASAIDLLRLPGMRRVTCIVWAIFFNVSLAYYGISLGIGDLGGSIFVNQLIAAAVEIPARMLGIFASYRIGRRHSIMISFGLAGGCLLATAFLFGNPSLTSVRIATAMTGKFWITLAFDLAWLYSAEVFPTVVRSLGVGTGSTFARVGAMVSTLVPGLEVIWRPLPFLVLAVGPIIVVLLAFAAPETRGRRLPDNLEEGEKMATGARGKNNDTEL